MSDAVRSSSLLIPYDLAYASAKSASESVVAGSIMPGVAGSSVVVWSLSDAPLLESARMTPAPPLRSRMHVRLGSVSSSACGKLCCSVRRGACALESQSNEMREGADGYGKRLINGPAPCPNDCPAS